MVLSDLQVLLGGDFDNDGDVDGRDFLEWQRGGSPSPLSSGDLADWQTNYGTTSFTAASNAIPEPSAIVHVVVGALMMFTRRKRPQR